jgi:hypothetical protein
MATEKFADSLSAGTHAQLLKLVGNWEGTSNTYFEPGVLADTSTTKAQIKAILGKQFLQMEYTSSMQGKPVEGLAIIGFYLVKREYTIAWIDSFHTGTQILISQGKEGPINVMGHYGDPSGGPDWGWRTTIEQTSDDAFVLRHFNVLPTGEEALAVETHFHKA